MVAFILCAIAGWICSLPATPITTPAPVVEQSVNRFWAMGQMWADTTDPGYCPPYTPYETNAAPPALSWPVPSGVLNENRGWRVGHTGLDIVAPLGTPVLSATSGIVVWAGVSTFFGSEALVVAVAHHGGWHSVFAHLSAINVVCGQWVGAGEKIGEVGATGAATYHHLHFDLRNGNYSYQPTF